MLIVDGLLLEPFDFKDKTPKCDHCGYLKVKMIGIDAYQWVCVNTQCPIYD